MENTSCGNECPFYKQGFCNSEKECPNYIEMWWEEGQTQTKKLVKDCSPKRQLIINMQLQNQILCLQQALTEMRNESQKVAGYFEKIVESSKVIIEQEEKRLQLDVLHPYGNPYDVKSICCSKED